MSSQQPAHRLRSIAGFFTPTAQVRMKGLLATLAHELLGQPLKAHPAAEIRKDETAQLRLVG